MDPKPDKEFEKHGDIILVYEIIANSIYWQDMPCRYGPNAERITLTKAGMAKAKEIIERAKKATRWDRRESSIFFPEPHFKRV